MAGSDNTVPLKYAASTVTLGDGTTIPNTLVLDCIQSIGSWTVTGREYTEAMSADRHGTTKPVLVATKDGNVTGSVSLLVKSFWGATAVTPYEFLTFTAGASAYASTALGSKKALSIEVATAGAAEDGNTAQTILFAYAVPTSVSIDPAGTDGMFTLSFDFVDHENAPTIS